MAQPAKQAPAETEVAAKPKSKKMLLIGIGVLVLGVGAGAGWYFTNGSKHEEAHAPAPMTPKFVVLEPFTLNLQREEGDQFLQVGITLKVMEPEGKSELEEKIKLHMPEIRSRLLLMLSNKRASELAPVEGKKKLAQEIVAETSAVLGLRAPALPKPAAHESAASAAEAPAAEGAAAPAEAASAAAQGNAGEGGTIDVLFTTFIIQ
jgi:flagellar protein FliL